MSNLGNNTAAAVAFSRFGLGGRPDDAIPASATQWLSSQLVGPDPCPSAGLTSTTAGLQLMANYRAATTPAAQLAASSVINQSMATEIGAYLLNGITTKLPFRERLVWFWTNHFALMADQPGVNCCAGAYVREAIRPYVNGTFTQMMLAVYQHPAMLYSLNNPGSTGPQSQAALACQTGTCTNNGINENLARECLELHTVGVNAGYTQADVDSMAMILTGWGVNLVTRPYGFNFNSRAHQPGNQTVMGQTFTGDFQGGINALTWLSTHPLTYQHLATKLVTHFVSDTPSSSDISTIAAALSSSGGSLTAAANALINLQSAWTPNQKLRNPQDYVIAVLRATGVTATGTTSINNAATSIMNLGSPVWQPQFPNGYSDLSCDWGGPAELLMRGDWINALASTLPSLDANTVAGYTVGPCMSAATQAAINAATTQHDKLTLLFSSPEFQRR